MSEPWSDRTEASQSKSCFLQDKDIIIKLTRTKYKNLVVIYHEKYQLVSINKIHQSLSRITHLMRKNQPGGLYLYIMMLLQMIVGHQLDQARPTAL